MFAKENDFWITKDGYIRLESFPGVWLISLGIFFELFGLLYGIWVLVCQLERLLFPHRPGHYVLFYTAQLKIYKEIDRKRQLAVWKEVESMIVGITSRDVTQIVGQYFVRKYKRNFCKRDSIFTKSELQKVIYVCKM